MLRSTAISFREFARFFRLLLMFHNSVCEKFVGMFNNFLVSCLRYRFVRARFFFCSSGRNISKNVFCHPHKAAYPLSLFQYRYALLQRKNKKRRFTKDTICKNCFVAKRRAYLFLSVFGRFTTQ